MSDKPLTKQEKESNAEWMTRIGMWELLTYDQSRHWASDGALDDYYALIRIKDDVFRLAIYVEHLKIKYSAK